MVLAALTVGCVIAPDPATAREPRLMEGKRTLYERVLLRPNARLRPTPDASAAATPVAPFSAYYVYDRLNRGGVEWVEVGAGRDGAGTSFITADKTIDWKQSMTLAFQNPAFRMDPDGPRSTLFFGNRDALVDLLHDEAMVATSQRWRSEARRALAAGSRVPEDNPVVTLEPETHVDIQQRFYLLPILSAETVLVRPLRTSMLVMNVASITEREAPPEPAAAQDAFRIGVVFVIDTTRSMGPYIDRTREAIRKIFTTLRASEAGEKISFGMVGFRDSIAAAPGLGYAVQVYAPLEEETDPDAFMQRIAAMSEATVSSRGFNEDALGGVQQAMDMPAWRHFQAKFIILITDASTRVGKDDELASVQAAPDEFNVAAQEKKFAIQVMHLKTPGGFNDHEVAERQYRALSRFGDQTLYYAVEGGGVAAFGAVVDTLAADLVNIGAAAAGGRLVSQDRTAPMSSIEEVGLAMQLAYLGSQRGDQAPDVIDAWIIDRDFSDIKKATVKPRVLLTKNQLSDLKVTIDKIIQLQSDNLLQPAEFFGRLQSVAGNMVRDPDRIAAGQVETLGDVLGEYLEGLPYDSEIMSLDQRAYVSMGPARQDTLLRRLHSKVDLYRRFNEDTSLWVRLAEGAPDGELVYPVPLEALP